MRDQNKDKWNAKTKTDACTHHLDGHDKAADEIVLAQRVLVKNLQRQHLHLRVRDFERGGILRGGPYGVEAVVLDGLGAERLGGRAAVAGERHLCIG